MINKVSFTGQKKVLTISRDGINVNSLQSTSIEDDLKLLSKYSSIDSSNIKGIYDDFNGKAIVIRKLDRASGKAKYEKELKFNDFFIQEKTIKLSDVGGEPTAIVKTHQLIKPDARIFKKDGKLEKLYLDNIELNNKLSAKFKEISTFLKKFASDWRLNHSNMPKKTRLSHRLRV